MVAPKKSILFLNKIILGTTLQTGIELHIHFYTFNSIHSFYALKKIQK